MEKYNRKYGRILEKKIEEKGKDILKKRGIFDKII
jgi:hypothetical protein